MIQSLNLLKVTTELKDKNQKLHGLIDQLQEIQKLRQLDFTSNVDPQQTNLLFQGLVQIRAPIQLERDKDLCKTIEEDDLKFKLAKSNY